MSLSTFARSTPLFYGVHVALFAALSALYRLSQPVPAPLQSQDSLAFFLGATTQRSWQVTGAIGTTYNPLQGLRDIFYPFVPQLVPQLLPLFLFTDPTVAITAVYILSVCLLFISSLTLYASVSMAPLVAVAGAWVTTILAISYTTLLLATPQWIHAVTCNGLLAALFGLIGRRSGLPNVLAISITVAARVSMRYLTQPSLC